MKIYSKPLRDTFKSCHQSCAKKVYIYGKNYKKYHVSKYCNNITDGAARCKEENLWVLEWYEAGRLEVNSTVCLVKDRSREGMDSMNIEFTFVGLELIQVLKYAKVRP